MKLDICIYPGDDNYAIVKEVTDGNQYLPEGSTLTAKNRFEYEDTASVDIFKLNATTGVSYTDAVITYRTESDRAQVKLTKDGWFTAIHIVIPTREWVYKELDNKYSIIYTYDVVYFTDGGDIYTCTKGKVEASNVQALLAETSKNTTISRVEGDYVSIAFLSEESNSLYKEIYESRLYNGACGLDACEANRLWAAINLIRHYVRWGQLAEAQRIIEKVNYFVGYESSDKSTVDKNKTGNCGCL